MKKLVKILDELLVGRYDAECKTVDKVLYNRHDMDREHSVEYTTIVYTNGTFSVITPVRVAQYGFADAEINQLFMTPEMFLENLELVQNADEEGLLPIDFRVKYEKKRKKKLEKENRAKDLKEFQIIKEKYNL